MSNTHIFNVSFDLEPTSQDKTQARIDRFLSTHFDELSRSRIKALIEEGQIKVNGKLCTPSTKLKEGDEIEVHIPQAQEASPQPEKIDLEILFEDEDLLVLNKPAGLVVHPGAGHSKSTLVNALLYHCGTSLSGIGGVKRPGIVHRLDKGTSGLMVVAKNDASHQGLSAQFEDRSLSRVYQAIIWGVINPLSGFIEGNIARDPKHRQRMHITAHGGKSAKTHYETLERLGHYASLVECRLETGRTHQIRVHLSSKHTGPYRHGLVMDPLYGKTPRGLALEIRKNLKELTQDGERLMLHAKTLKFIHPISGKKMSFKTDLPEDLDQVIEYLKTVTPLS